MTIEVLVSTMHRSDHSMSQQMNIKTDAVFINQCDHFGYEEQTFGDRRIRWFHFPERGIGLSRNTALMRAVGDIVLFADDDVVYDAQYEDTVLNAFRAHPEAGVIVFNLESQNPERPEYLDQKDHRLHWYNCLRYGAFRIAARREVLLRHNLTFSLLFGGGAPYQAGEDNLFLSDCLRSGVICRASCKSIGTVKQEQSTWFRGYDAKYYHDRGALFAAMYGKKSFLAVVLMELKTSARKPQLSLSDRLSAAFSGIRSFRGQESAANT